MLSLRFCQTKLNRNNGITLGARFLVETVEKLEAPTDEVVQLKTLLPNLEHMDGR